MRLPSGLRLDGTPFEEREFTQLWLIATATYGVGDIVTTIALFEYSATISEANPLLQSIMETFGQAGLVSIKLAVFLICIFVSVDAANRGDRLIFYLPPVVLALVGAFTTAYNLRLLIG